MEKLKQHFLRASMLEKIIYINVAVFIFELLISSFSGLFNNQVNFIDQWFALSSSLDAYITKPWSIITYGFLHADFFHLLSNCIWLYIFGRLFSEYFTPKQLLNFYLLGTIFGGIFFMIAMNYFPAFNSINHLLVGASAGVSAIIIGTATYIPNYELKIPLINVFIKVWQLAAFFVLMDLISLAGSNGGGHFAHLGGALFGFIYVQQSSNKEIKFLSSLKKWFKRDKKNLKTVYKSDKPRRNDTNRKSDNQQRIDAILDKIGKSGYDALTKEEKDFLFKQGNPK
ncbi:rhomboid family intramembrane serine protease [Tenacibaculum sp. SZ-18]|uniref:rhomboid family protein n=1 Tax=Tenacibaculum sp. SZ-18 TaxID=754423 RepID=UPI000C2D330A|nr:rhomboid family intramembrane serine protease [Tenacibaculum sp. SZ-18]AUC14311.1 rhomboid family intramembrane serine protease [Tenacibaculum sp. SZ-18]